MSSSELDELLAQTKKQLLHLQSLGVEGIQLGQADHLLQFPSRQSRANSSRAIR